ncbi:hypothetical protein LZ30DRAFT_732539 [Colletotrichum cereale]|nr:hypothetical protein LZ30DRAFT_732539 [Colletotrichum cereale]
MGRNEFAWGFGVRMPSRLLDLLHAVRSTATICLSGMAQNRTPCHSNITMMGGFFNNTAPAARLTGQARSQYNKTKQPETKRYKSQFAPNRQRHKQYLEQTRLNSDAHNRCPLFPDADHRQIPQHISSKPSRISAQQLRSGDPILLDALRKGPDSQITSAQQVSCLDIRIGRLVSAMDVQVKNEELDDLVKIEVANDPVKRGQGGVQVKVEEEEVSALPSRLSSQPRSALSVAATTATSEDQRSFANLQRHQATARPARLAVRNNASAIAPSTAPANILGRRGPAHVSLPYPSSALRSSAEANAPPPRGSVARRSFPTKLQSATAKAKSAFRHHTASYSGPNLMLDALLIPPSTPPSQPDKHIRGERRPVSPMKTTKLITSPAHPGVAASFREEARTRLDDKFHEDWTYTSPTGSIKKMPRRGSCGSWEVSLPPKMDTIIHIDPYIDRLSDLLQVQIEPTQSPPSIHVKLFESQLAEQAKHEYLLEEHTALKWKAWGVLAAWADHLVRRGAPPAIPPVDLVSFVRNKLLAEGRHAKANAVNLLHARQGVTLLSEGQDTSQIPRLTPVDLLPKPKSYSLDAQQPSLMSAERPPQASEAGHKHLLSDDSSSSSGSDSSPEVQTKRLRRKRLCPLTSPGWLLGSYCSPFSSVICN